MNPEKEKKKVKVKQSPDFKIKSLWILNAIFIT